jgi:predicted lipase
MGIVIGNGITIKDGVVITPEYQVLENVVATNLSATSATVSWSAIANTVATGYKITATRQDAPGGPGLGI